MEVTYLIDQQREQKYYKYVKKLQLKKKRQVNYDKNIRNCKLKVNKKNVQRGLQKQLENSERSRKLVGNELVRLKTESDSLNQQKQDINNNMGMLGNWLVRIGQDVQNIQIIMEALVNVGQQLHVNHIGEFQSIIQPSRVLNPTQTTNNVSMLSFAKIT